MFNLRMVTEVTMIASEIIVSNVGNSKCRGEAFKIRISVTCLRFRHRSHVLHFQRSQVEITTVSERYFSFYAIRCICKLCTILCPFEVAVSGLIVEIGVRPTVPSIFISCITN